MKRLTACAGLQLLLMLLLCGCATPRPELAQVRALAAGTDALTAFSELSQRHVDTYRRARPFLSPAEDARERLLDAQRRAAPHKRMSRAWRKPCACTCRRWAGWRRTTRMTCSRN